MTDAVALLNRLIVAAEKALGNTSVMVTEPLAVLLDLREAVEARLAQPCDGARAVGEAELVLVISLRQMMWMREAGAAAREAQWRLIATTALTLTRADLAVALELANRRPEP